MVRHTSSRPQTGEQFVVPGGAVARRVLDRADPGGPGTVRRDLARQPVRRLFHVVRGLHRQAAARRQLAHQARIEFLVPRHPLQGGVRQDHVVASRRIPGGDVRQLEGQAGQALARRVDHVLRIVRAADRGIRIARGQHLGGVARAAAQVHGPRHARWAGRRPGRAPGGCVRSRRRNTAWLTSSWRLRNGVCVPCALYARNARATNTRIAPHPYRPRMARPPCNNAPTPTPESRMTALVLLPGMDGTGDLFAPLLSALSPPCGPLSSATPATGRWAMPSWRRTRDARYPGPAFRAAGRIVLRPHRRRSAARLARADPVRDLPAQSPAGTGLRPIPDRPAPGLCCPAPCSSACCWDRAPIPACGPSCWTRCRGSRIGSCARLRAVMEVDAGPCMSGVTLPVLYLRARDDRVVRRRAGTMSWPCSRRRDGSRSPRRTACCKPRRKRRGPSWTSSGRRPLEAAGPHGISPPATPPCASSTARTARRPGSGRRSRPATGPPAPCR